MSKTSRSQKIIQNFHNSIFGSKKIEMKDTILIVGAPRSGTTWLMEILATLPEYTYIFEPLNPIWCPESFEVGFRSRTYLSSDSKWQEGKDFLRKTFTGQIANLAIKDSIILSFLTDISIKNTMSQLTGNKLIVKSVNMNRFLPWIAKQFQLRNIFFIIRHPCAVVASQLKSGLCGYRPSSPPYKDIFPTPDIILDEASKINELDTDIIDKLKKIKTREEILAAAWCLDNYILLSHPKPHPWSLIFYEKLVKDGEKEIIRIFNEIGEKRIPKKAFKNLKKPSMVIMKEELKSIIKPELQLSKWKGNLSEDQINIILQIVSDFGLDLYTEKLEPKYEKING
jgi:hypothetical protein